MKMNMQSVCRTCLKENAEMKSIFCENDTENLSLMIATCTVTTVSELDGLPGQMCLQCIENIKISYVFKQQCEKAYETLKSLLGIHIETDGIGLTEKPTDGQPIDESVAKDESSDSENDTEHQENDVRKSTVGSSDDFKHLGPNEKCIQTDQICFYPCEMCELKFINDDALKIHRNVHKESGYNCRVCSKVYSRLTHLRRHISAMHPDFVISKALDEIVCTVCNRQFTRVEHLRRHLSTHESKVPKIECDAEMDDGENGKLSDSEAQSNAEDGPSAAGTGTTLKSEDIDDEDEKKVNRPNLDEGRENILNSVPIELVKVEHITDMYDEDDEDDADVPVGGNFNDDAASSIPSESSSSSDDETFRPKRKKRGRGRPRKSEQTTTSPNKRGRKKQLPCDLCKKTFVDPIKLQLHKMAHDSKAAPQVHKCSKCDKTFSRATHLKRHLITHSDIKPYSCNICEKKFSRIDHLNIHKHHHSDIKPHICDICQRGFTRAEHLRKHKEARHGEKTASVKTEFCEICQKGFTTPKYLQVHMRTHTDRVYTCKFCDEKFGMKSELNEHTKKHVNERPFLCSECGLRFVRNDYLVIHMRRHKGEKPYKCKYCGKGFPRATDLTVHERYHTGEKTHLCTICGKGFQRAYNLLVHTRVHTGERPYQCPHCSKSFAQGNDLKAHVRRHTGERYKCDICGDGFIQGYHLTQHKRNVHGIDMKSHIRRVEKFVPNAGTGSIDSQSQQQQQQEDLLQPSQAQQQQHNQSDLQDLHNLQMQQLQRMQQQQQDANSLNISMLNEDVKVRPICGDMNTSSHQSMDSFPSLGHDEIKIEPTMIHIPDSQINDSQSSHDVHQVSSMAQSDHHSSLSGSHSNLLEQSSTAGDGAGLNLPFMSHLISSMHPKYKLPQSFQ